ncbi:TetR/AcrR family transcriptional regulator [Aldersonia kunmingensis]|uniref:TetR/AcrR family transcriptional regulator n=1 Tax=Aldersonia kunmingensis TaxID=408066 RepID=UPI000835549B|nr:TetR family transcriptional regulator [Aldersonia kunmingensis]
MSATASQSRGAYPEAARALLRDTVLDAVRELLTERDWSKINLTDVAKRAGVSRQTLYNEFGSRAGLAEGYALRLADRLVDHVDVAIAANVDDVDAGLRDAFRGFFLDSATDPLIQSLLSGEAKPDLLRLVTLDSGPIIERASTRLAETFQTSWVAAPAQESEILARAVVRLAMSYVSVPPEAGRDVGVELAMLLGPFVADVVARSRSAAP